MIDARMYKVRCAVAAVMVSALLVLAPALPCYADSSIYRTSNNVIPNKLKYAYTSSDGEYVYSQINIMKSGQYTISVDARGLVVVLTYDNEQLYWNGGIPQTFEIDNDDTKVSIFVYTNDEVNPSDIKLMVNKGSKPLPYEPYWEGYKIVYDDIAEQAGTSFEPVLQIVVPYTLLLLGVVIAVYSALRIVRRTAR